MSDATRTFPTIGGPSLWPSRREAHVDVSFSAQLCCQFEVVGRARSGCMPGSSRRVSLDIKYQPMSRLLITFKVLYVVEAYGNILTVGDECD